jgi:flagellar biosynthetic protein FliQ
MTSDQALYLMMGLLEHAVWIAGPVLGAALVGGVFIGVLQTATQINEMSIAYVVKAGCVMLVFLFAGSALMSKTMDYTKTHFKNIAKVVR